MWEGRESAERWWVEEVCREEEEEMCREKGEVMEGRGVEEGEGEC